jgi:hypothetical protein
MITPRRPELEDALELTRFPSTDGAATTAPRAPLFFLAELFDFPFAEAFGDALATEALDDCPLDLTNRELVGVGVGDAVVADLPDPTMTVPFIVGCTAHRNAYVPGLVKVTLT